MERFYQNLLQTQRGRAECLQEAQDFLKTLTIGDIRDEWLTRGRFAQVERVSKASAFFLKRLKHKADEFMPFSAPFYWAAFICIGDPRPMKWNVEDPPKSPLERGTFRDGTI
ncbi:CHAT domain-containing protein [Oxynema sp. CENA135]|nr:CHAT domain-containing protein [Oxynema sp. CENA135]